MKTAIAVMEFVLVCALLAFAGLTGSVVYDFLMGG